jgi:gamma-glutamyltranspeptidase/glutathione hydrolase
VIRGVAIAGSDRAAVVAGEGILEAGGSAVDAVIAGFFGAAGAHPGVLLAPAVALVAGAAVGARAFDGRSAQPGRGAARPRGFVEEGSIPEAARFAVPRSLAMLVLLHTYAGRAKWRELVKPGALTADKVGAGRRAALLRSAGDLGVMALRSRDVERALLERGGSVEGGTLTAEDLAEIRPENTGARTSAIGEQVTVVSAPWDASTGSEVPSGSSLEAEVLVACDGRGGVAALAYSPAREGIAIDALELLVNREAAPVRRGVPRVAPGTVFPAPSPIAILSRSGGFWVAVGFPGRASIEPEALLDLSSGLAVETALTDLRDQTRSRAVFAALRDGRTARPIAIE